jgi:hypothetical protein
MNGKVTLGRGEPDLALKKKQVNTEGQSDKISEALKPKRPSVVRMPYYSLVSAG